MAPIDSSAAEVREQQRLRDEQARYQRIERIERRFEERRCIDCGKEKHTLSITWILCPTCRSLTCRTCRKSYQKGKEKDWRCLGCGQLVPRHSDGGGWMRRWLR